MKAELRRKLQAGLDRLEAHGGPGTVALLCNLPARLILARGAAAPRSQARADALARQAIADVDDPIIDALFRQAADAGQPAIARRLAQADASAGVARVPGSDEAVVLNATTTPDATRLLGCAEELLALIHDGEEKAA